MATDRRNPEDLERYEPTGLLVHRGWSRTDRAPWDAECETDARIHTSGALLAWTADVAQVGPGAGDLGVGPGDRVAIRRGHGCLLGSRGTGDDRVDVVAVDAGDVVAVARRDPAAGPRAAETSDQAQSQPQDQRDAPDPERGDLRTAIVDLLASAHPRPEDHPAMSEAWTRARRVLERYSGSHPRLLSRPGPRPPDSRPLVPVVAWRRGSPPGDLTCLVTWTGAGLPVVRIGCYVHGRWYLDGQRADEVTAWVPLPDPAQESP